MITRLRGANNQFDIEKTASTAIALNTLLTISTAGRLTPAVTASTNIAGVAMELIASTDTDYTGTRKITVDLPRPTDLFEIDSTGAAITQTMVGEFFDLTDAGTLNLAAGGTVKHCKLVGFTATASGSKVIVQINPLVVFTA